MCRSERRQSAAASAPPARYSRTSSGKLGRRPTFYRLLNAAERNMVLDVFGSPFPYRMGIGNGLGFDGRPWTDMSAMSEPGMPEQMQYQITCGMLRARTSSGIRLRDMRS